MIKQTITYVDFNDEERTEDFYFNLTKAELADLQFKTPGGFTEMVEQITKTQDGPKLAELFQQILIMSYGEKSADNKYFDKSPEIANRFKNSAAYSELYMSLLSDADKAAAFIKGVLPKLNAEEQAAADKMMAEKNVQMPRISSESVRNNQSNAGLR